MAVGALEKAGFRIVRQEKYIVTEVPPPFFFNLLYL
jgi:hypothetical protein